MDTTRGKQSNRNFWTTGEVGLTSNETNHGLPNQCVRFEDVPLAMEAVVNQLAQDILMVRFKHSISFFHLKAKGVETVQKEGLKYECVKIHELRTDTDESIGTSGMSPLVSLHQSYQKLRYAFSTYNSSTTYIVEFEERIPDVLSKRQYCLQGCPSVDNHSACVQIKFDKDQSRFIACLTDAPSCNVWDCRQRVLLSSLPLNDKGVCVCWHNADAFKIMVALRDGNIIFYNFIKQQSIQSVNVGKAPILSVDWAPNNSCFIGCATHTSVHIIDVAKPYISQFKTLEAHSCFTSRLKFCPWDSKRLATSSRSDGSVKLFRLNQQTLAWSIPKMEVQDIEWAFGGSCLLVAAGKTLWFFEVQL